ncbi:MAG TPA: hypothetical protein VFS07_05305 [Gemmatimonadales bacterium]|jgi:hypothetical protein|nr:hypothetical protein [Gemmatimonadales bacterium]
MKLIDPTQTIVIVHGTAGRAATADRELAWKLKREVDRRADGTAFRRAVVVGDEAYYTHDAFEPSPVIAVGGPGVNRASEELSPHVPLVFQQEDRVFVQARLESADAQVVLWGADAAATAQAVEAFLFQGVLDQMLERLWREAGPGQH